MRALCGSIITAGALIGLGLTALGFGIRFQGMMVKHEEGTYAGAYYGGPTLTLALVILIAAVIIGVGLAVVGLAYHHERRHHERLHLTGTAGGTRTPV